MNIFRALFPVVLIAAWSSASAETIKFEEAAGLLGASCAKDIEANCRGVNLDPTRMKDCLYRNQDSLSAQCSADYARAFDAIQKRVAARAAVPKLCDRDALKLLRAELFDGLSFSATHERHAAPNSARLFDRLLDETDLEWRLAEGVAAAQRAAE